MKVAVMQPYFFPYLGYIQLMDLADIFVVFDCVQFPRRGWVHRNQFNMKSGKVDWVTLPILKGGRDETRILDLRFVEKSSENLKSQLEKTEAFTNLKNNPTMYNLVLNTNTDVTSYLCLTLEYISHILELKTKFIRSSQMNIESNLKGQDRVLNILSKLGATTYFNLSGGAKLYSQDDFEKMNIELKILHPYHGSQISILERLLREDKEYLLSDLRSNY